MGHEVVSRIGPNSASKNANLLISAAAHPSPLAR
jgi:hypothetical protein